MPEVDAFLAAFDLVRGNYFAPGLKLTRISSRHIVKEPFRLYEFPLVLHFTSHILPDHISLATDMRIVHSKYGNPYECRIQDVKIVKHSSYRPLDGGPKLFEITATALGVAKRKGK
jgi:hypothetical protein